MIKKQFIFILLVLLLLTGCIPETTSLPENSLSVHFIDVGQGDAILLVDGDETMLVDSGNQIGFTLPMIRKLRIRDIVSVAIVNHNQLNNSLFKKGSRRFAKKTLNIILTISPGIKIKNPDIIKAIEVIGVFK